MTLEDFKSSYWLYIYMLSFTEWFTFIEDEVLAADSQDVFAAETQAVFSRIDDEKGEITANRTPLLLLVDKLTKI